MAFKARIVQQLTVTEPIDLSAPLANQRLKELVHDALNSDLTYDGTSDPIVSKTAPFEQALASGAATIDLTALVGSLATTVDGTGLKITQAILKGKTTNAAAITLMKGASDGASTFGTNWSFDLAPGQSVVWNLLSASELIDGTHKTIDLSGTDEDVLQIIFVLGTDNS